MLMVASVVIRRWYSSLLVWTTMITSCKRTLRGVTSDVDEFVQ